MKFLLLPIRSSSDPHQIVSFRAFRVSTSSAPGSVSSSCVLQFPEVFKQPEPCPVQQIEFGILKFDSPGGENGTKQIFPGRFIKRHAPTEFVKSRNYENFRVSPDHFIIKIQVFEVFPENFGIEARPYPDRVIC